ncbi:hypothetical protein [Hyalangium versicolor]|uniref:hypothetical protein n=1 Tax=Hyalangium versicolor TaxID=2861190 RepID=UPI001CCECE1A|nr:hypothetical protein [Hyalangium versicolor]
MSNPVAIGAVVGLVLVFLAIFYVFWRINQRRMAAWAEFASRHDMHAEGFQIDGSYEGYPLRLETQRRGAGQHSHTVTVLRLSLSHALPPEFSLDREGLGTKVLRAFGKKDEEVGDPEFDRHFNLKNLSSETTALLNRPSVQQLLYELLDQYRAFHIRDGWLQAERGGIPGTADALEEFTGPALMLAHTLEESARRAKGQTRG